MHAAFRFIRVWETLDLHLHDALDRQIISCPSTLKIVDVYRSMALSTFEGNSAQ